MIANRRNVMYRINLRSRHPSHDILRTELKRMPFRSIVRLGSTTVLNDGLPRIECNSVQGVNNSANKLFMKQCFTVAGVKTADWWVHNTGISFKQMNSDTTHSIDSLPYPIIIKHVMGSRGTGNYMINTKEEFADWLTGRNLDNLHNYIFEKYYTYSREYRLHITADGCFYTCRKMLKSDTPSEKRFQRHDDNCVWYMEDNEKFDKPVNWDLVVTHCIKALGALGLDIACFDVKIQSATDRDSNKRENPEFIIIESGSAPSFGTVTAQKYLEQIPKVLQKKYDEA